MDEAYLWNCTNSLEENQNDITVELDIPPNVTAEFISETDSSRRVFGSGHHSFQLKADAGTHD